MTGLSPPALREYLTVRRQVGELYKSPVVTENE